MSYRRQLEAVLAKWRKDRERVAEAGMSHAGTKRGYEAAGTCAAYETCIRELEAAITSRRQEQR